MTQMHLGRQQEEQWSVRTTSRPKSEGRCVQVPAVLQSLRQHQLIMADSLLTKGLPTVQVRRTKPGTRRSQVTCPGSQSPHKAGRGMCLTLRAPAPQQGWYPGSLPQPAAATAPLFHRQSCENVPRRGESKGVGRNGSPTLCPGTPRALRSLVVTKQMQVSLTRYFQNLFHTRNSRPSFSKIPMCICPKMQGLPAPSPQRSPVPAPRGCLAGAP